VGRGDINHMGVFISVLYLKAEIRKDGAALDKGGRGKGNSFPVFYKRAENLQKTLYTRSNHNAVRRAENVSPFSYINRKHLTEIRFSLRLSVGEKAGGLPESAFHIPPP